MRKRGRDETEEGSVQEGLVDEEREAAALGSEGVEKIPSKSSTKRQKVVGPGTTPKPRMSAPTSRPAGMSILSKTTASTATLSPPTIPSTWTYPYPLATSSAPGAVLDIPHDAPKWLSRAVKLLDVDFGPSWVRVVELWFTREESFSFTDKGRFPDKERCRPDAIGMWQKYDRNPSWRPTSIHLESYAKDFWDWWLAIQPKRRVNERTRRSIRNEGLLDMSVFDVRGALGMLQVIAALFFWGNAIVDDRKAGGHAGEDGSWVEAVNDVFWVLERLYATT